MAQHSYNTKFYYYNSTFLSVGAVKSVQLGMSASTVDVTHLGSANREFIRGIPDAGEVSLELIFDTTSSAHQYLQTAAQAAAGTALDQFKVSFANGAYYTFYGIVTEFAPQAPEDEALTASITIKVSGAITFSATA